MFHFEIFKNFSGTFSFSRLQDFEIKMKHVKMIFAKKRRKNEEMSKTKKINIEIIQ